MTSVASAYADAEVDPVAAGRSAQPPSAGLFDLDGPPDGATTNGGRRRRHPADPFRAGHRIAPGYTVQQHLSRGDAFDVYEVWSSLRQCSCIAKTVRPDCRSRRMQERLAAEGRLLVEATHPHLLRAYEIVGGERPVVILETLPGPTLEAMVENARRRLASGDLCQLGLQLCSVVGYLHRRGCLHLDIRPANIIASDGLAKLIDLSLARPPGPAPAGNGCPNYLAPEQARGDAVWSGTDVWGIGATLYEAATGQKPFAPLDASEQELCDRDGYVQLVRPVVPLRRLRRGLPSRFVAAVEQCLQPSPSRRPTVARLTRELTSLLDQ